MAKKLGNTVPKKMAALNTLAKRSEQFQKDINEETNVEQIPEELKKHIIYLPDERLEDDPLNQEFYGELEVDMLAEAMKNYGFQGIILAYPYGEGYRIEAGHRRRLAARKAGFKEYPVLPTEPPKTEWERRMRLFLSNLHGRREKPMIMARVAQGLFESHEMEIKDKKSKNLIQEGEITALNELVAMDMELDIKTVEKYRALIKLIPELQEMADMGYSWSALSEASPMNAEKQQVLAEMIKERTEEQGQKSVDRSWMKKVIKSLKLDQGLSEIEKLQQEPAKVKNKNNRRKNGTKMIMNCAKSLSAVCDNEEQVLIKDDEVESVINVLEGMAEKIELQIKKLKERT